MVDEKVLRTEIRNKLQEYESDTDGLAEYIAVMMGNKRDKEHVLSDLELFLTPNHKSFVDWLFSFMEKLNHPQEKHSNANSQPTASNSKTVTSAKSTSSKQIHRPKIEEKPSLAPIKINDDSVSAHSISRDKKTLSSERSRVLKSKLEVEKPTNRKNSVLKKTISDAINSKSSRNVATNKDDRDSISTISALSSSDSTVGVTAKIRPAIQSLVLSSKKRNLICLNEFSEAKPHLSEMQSTFSSNSSDLREILNDKRRKNVNNESLHSDAIVGHPSSIGIVTRLTRFGSSVQNKMESSITKSQDPITSNQNDQKSHSTSANPPSKIDGKQTKCRFWPACRDISNCPYFHPSVRCSTFPQCKYGNQCLFIHPVCKFNESCKNRQCIFLHFQSPLINISADILGFKQQIKAACHFGMKCTNRSCSFSHPPSLDSSSSKKSSNPFKWNAGLGESRLETPLPSNVSIVVDDQSTTFITPAHTLQEEHSSSFMDCCD